MKIEFLKVDSSFPDASSEKLKFLLSEGYEIIDKSIVGERFLIYVLRLEVKGQKDA